MRRLGLLLVPFLFSLAVCSRFEPRESSIDPEPTGSGEPAGTSSTDAEEGPERTAESQSSMEEIEPEVSETASEEAAAEGAAPGETPAEEKVEPAAETVTDEAPAEPETGESDGVETAVLEQPAPRPRILSMWEIQDQIKGLLPENAYLVTKNGIPLPSLQDLDFDGLPEVLVPCVLSEKEVDGDSFTDYSRLFGSKNLSYSFRLLLFSMKQERLTLRKQIDLGYRFVYGGVSRIPIRKVSPHPFIIAASFQTQLGDEQEWLIFSGDSFEPVSRLSLKEGFSDKLLIEDVDRNGDIDVVIQERGAEEGIGMETYLTWFRWNGREFAEYATANILRSLREFLSRVRELFLEEEWDELLNASFLPQDLREYRNSEPEETVLEVFGLANFFDSDERSPGEILQGVRDIVFPDFLENPFLARDDRGFYLRLSFRFVEATGVSMVSEVYLHLAKNPFDERQFYFSPG